MALSGLDIYKLLPKTNCRKCGFQTCLAFAMQLAAKKASLDKCPDVSEEAKKALASAAEPPIRLVTVGSGDAAFAVGNETVLFRHDETFHHEPAIGFLMESSDKGLAEKADSINRLAFERAGQRIRANLAAVRDTDGNAANYTRAVERVCAATPLPLMLMSGKADVLKQAAAACRDRRPLLYRATESNWKDIAEIASLNGLPVVASGEDTGSLAAVAASMAGAGVRDIVLEIRAKSVGGKLDALTHARRLALKRNFRPLGYPTLVFTESGDIFQETAEAATYIAKYGSIIVMRGSDPCQILPLLTERQNIFTDPQKPLQVEPKLYEIGKAGADSPLLVTTNFSLTYYTVESEVEASRVPTYVLSVDCDGMSVLTAWAADKFNPEKIAEALRKSGAASKVGHNTVIIPGYVAVMSAKLEDECGMKVVVGPREASGIPKFLKNLHA